MLYISKEEKNDSRLLLPSCLRLLPLLPMLRAYLLVSPCLKHVQARGPVALRPSVLT